MIQKKKTLSSLFSSLVCSEATPELCWKHRIDPNWKIHCSRLNKLTMKLKSNYQKQAGHGSTLSTKIIK
jgi:hypothetical protein